MAGRHTMPIKRGTKLPPGKGWRLRTPRHTRYLKAALVSKFTSKGSTFAIFRVVK